MAEMTPFIEILGYWLGIFLTLAILSFLYKDNPFYKFAEHLFIGVSIGYIITQQYYDVLEPKLVDRIGIPAWHLFGVVVILLLALGAAALAVRKRSAGAVIAAGALVVILAGTVYSLFELGHHRELGGLVSTRHWWIGLIPLCLCLMMFAKSVSPRWSWIGRYPLAFVVAFYAALEVNGLVQADLGEQMKRSITDLDSEKLDVNDAPEEALIKLPGLTPPVARQIVEGRAEQRFTSIDQVAALPGLTDAERAMLADERGHLIGLDALAGTGPGQRNWFRILSELLLLCGLLASLIYFYFSIEQKGAVGKVSRFGVWILMIGFGASFGYTVQGRLALAIGRAVDLMGKDKDPVLADRIQGPLVAGISIAVIFTGIVLWELKLRRAARAGGQTGGQTGGTSA
jgi:hypothetical protein